MNSREKGMDYGLDLHFSTVSGCKSHTPFVNNSIHEQDAERKEWTLDLTYSSDLFPDCKSHTPSVNSSIHDKDAEEKNGVA